MPYGTRPCSWCGVRAKRFCFIIFANAKIDISPCNPNPRAVPKAVVPRGTSVLGLQYALLVLFSLKRKVHTLLRSIINISLSFCLFYFPNIHQNIPVNTVVKITVYPEIHKLYPSLFAEFAVLFIKGWNRYIQCF